MEYVRQNKINFRRWWREYKTQFVCAECGESDPACIDFHHEGDKNEAVSQLLYTFSKKRVLEEVSKCIPLCANCHRKLHAQRR